MSVMTSKQLSSAIKSIKTNRVKLQENIQEALIAATFYAMKDGNITPFNQLLDAVGNATHLKGITMWAETYAPVIIRKGEFTLNKTMAKEHDINSEADFAPYEVEIRAGAKWFEIAGEQKVVSIFDPANYLGKVADKLAKEGFPDLAYQLRAVKGDFEMHLIEAIEAIEAVDGFEDEVEPTIRAVA
jgi:hypothetical protein